MSDVRVKGFYDITFWQDEGIGLVVLRSDDQGLIRGNALAELVAAIGTASFDDQVKSVAITGLNNKFSSGLKEEKIDSETANNIFSNVNSLISLIYSLEKPIFTVLPGDALDTGYEIALLGDIILAAEGTTVGYNSNHVFMAGGSITTSKFRDNFDIREAEAGKNVDVVLPKDTMLEEAKKYIKAHQGYDYHLLRRRSMRNMRESLLEEKENFFRKYVLS